MSIIVLNRVNFNEYTVYKTFVAGICLKPQEVKDIIKGSCSLRGAYVYMLENKIQIIKMYINSTEYASRPILLKKKEIKSLIAEFIEGKILIPKSIFKKNNLIKLELVLCKKNKKGLTKKLSKLREMDIKEARRYNVFKIKIT